MEETRDPQAASGGPGERQQPDADATSSETLGDIEEGANVESTGATGSQLEGSSPAPAPDGGRADGSDTGGPM
jgi:hypothetical protein